jgi:hypothetical protein
MSFKKKRSHYQNDLDPTFSNLEVNLYPFGVSIVLARPTFRGVWTNWYDYDLLWDQGTALFSWEA